MVLEQILRILCLLTEINLRIFRVREIKLADFGYRSIHVDGRDRQKLIILVNHPGVSRRTCNLCDLYFPDAVMRREKLREAKKSKWMKIRKEDRAKERQQGCTPRRVFHFYDCRLRCDGPISKNYDAPYISATAWQPDRDIYIGDKLF